MGFSGFSRDVPGFLAGFAANNRRDWYEDNKERFRALCVEPALDLVAALAPVAEALTPPHRAEARLNGSLRRIHRDVRFSRDKTPYDPRIHLVF
jgi:uncharacterized protein (TIGR02453 family)